MRRRAFLISSAAAVSCAPLLGATSSEPPLRVLLGEGDAQPIPGGGFEFKGNAYRGTFARAPEGIVNVVALEEYLYSVVPREMPASWPANALQAQAICARTFVLGHTSPQRSYDVLPSTLNQVYDGVRAESPAGSAAVDATAGMVLRYDGALAQVAYSSCCGGHTEASSDAWGGAALAYLAGVVCPYCVQAPEFDWTRDIAFDQIERALPEAFRGAGTLRDVRIASRDGSGRAREFELVTDRGTTVVRGSDFRLAVGADLVRSLLILSLSVLSAEGTLTTPLLHVEGAGNGHGVGLCQWGSRTLALDGLSSARIAAFYFPGTTIDTWTNAPSQPTSTSFLRH